MYHIAENGKAIGPYDYSSLKAMALNGKLKPDTLVWTQGMSTWEKASEIDDFKTILMFVIPPIPE